MPNLQALPALLAGAFMVVLDFFIVNVALPSVATGLHATESALEWVVAGYGLTFAAFLITAGRLGDAIERWTWVSLAPAPFVLAAFIARQRRHEHPLLDLSLFKARSFSAGLLTQFCLACTQASLTAGLLALALAADSTIAALAPGLALAGAGIGLCLTPLTSIVLADIDPAKVGGASVALSTIQQIGFALGVAITGVIYFAEPDPVSAFTLSLVQLAVPAAAIMLSSLRLRVPATVTA